MSNIEVKNLLKSQRLVPAVAKLYAACFGEGDNPQQGWGERAACWENTCLDDGRGKIVPYVEVETPCPTCTTPMDEAYPLEWTINYILDELSYPGAVALVGIVNNIVAAAAWGFEDNITNVATKKYPDVEDMQKRVIDAYQSIWPNQENTRHISEVFVRPKFRGKDYAQILVRKMVEGSQLPITSRTLDTSPMTTVFDKVGLVQALGPDSDPKNSNRVFYVSPKKQ